jgi:hypothetical protein
MYLHKIFSQMKVFFEQLQSLQYSAEGQNVPKKSALFWMGNFLVCPMEISVCPAVNNMTYAAQVL